jgi:hypothetical protein
VQLSAEEEARRSAYYHNVILPDEKRFLVSAATEHMKVVQGITGDERVVIEGGKGVIEVCIPIGSAWICWLSILMSAFRFLGIP